MEDSWLKFTWKDGVAKTKTGKLLDNCIKDSFLDESPIIWMSNTHNKVFVYVPGILSDEDKNEFSLSTRIRQTRKVAGIKSKIEYEILCLDLTEGWLNGADEIRLKILKAPCKCCGIRLGLSIHHFEDAHLEEAIWVNNFHKLRPNDMVGFYAIKDVIEKFRNEPTTEEILNFSKKTPKLEAILINGSDIWKGWSYSESNDSNQKIISWDEHYANSDLDHPIPLNKLKTKRRLKIEEIVRPASFRRVGSTRVLERAMTNLLQRIDEGPYQQKVIDTLGL
jgi:hypothetical protein